MPTAHANWPMALTTEIGGTGYLRDASTKLRTKKKLRSVSREKTGLAARHAGTGTVQRVEFYKAATVDYFLQAIQQIRPLDTLKASCDQPAP